jgi:hypothetical protein
VLHRASAQRSPWRWRHPVWPLHLSGRSSARLEAVAQTRGRGGIVTTTTLDVRNADAMAAWVGGAGNRFPMPGLVEADRAADLILRGVAAGRMRVVLPWRMGLAARIAWLLPPRMMAALATWPR